MQEIYNLYLRFKKALEICNFHLEILDLIFPNERCVNPYKDHGYKKYYICIDIQLVNVDCNKIRGIPIRVWCLALLSLV